MIFLIHERPKEDKSTKTLRSGGGKGGKIADDLLQHEPGSQTPGAPGTGTGTGGTMTGTSTGTVPVTGTSTVAKGERYIFILLIHQLIIMA